MNEIQFVDSTTGAPLATIKGEKAQLIVKYSDLIHALLESDENRPNPNVLVVPIGPFPADRHILFANMMRGLPVGRDDGNSISYYPLTPLEEQEIQTYVDSIQEKEAIKYPTKTPEQLRVDLINNERKRVVFETLGFLSIPDSIIQYLIPYEDIYKQNENANTMLNESIDDKIERYVKEHIRWLFITDQAEKLTEKQIVAAKDHFDKIQKNYNDGIQRITAHNRKRGQRRYYNNYNHNDSNNAWEYERQIEETYNDLMNQDTYEPVDLQKTGSMTPIQYEKYLRTKFFRSKPRALPMQHLYLNMLYNNNNNNHRRKTRNSYKNRNNSAVIFYNPNDTGRKRYNNKTKKQNKRNIWNVGNKK